MSLPVVPLIDRTWQDDYEIEMVSDQTMVPRLTDAAGVMTRHMGGVTGQYPPCFYQMMS